MGRRSRGDDAAAPATFGALALQGWGSEDEEGLSVSPAPPAASGPYDSEEIDPELTVVARVDFGAIRVPVPAGGRVTADTSDGRLQAVHVTLPGGRLSVSALAAPRGERLWPDLAAEIDASLREGGATVRSYQGRWGRELHARTGGASSVFVGADGARWMVYGVATGPSRDAEELDAALRWMLGGTVVVRGRSPYPPRTVLPLTVPPHLAAAPDRPDAAGGEQAAGEEFALRTAQEGAERHPAEEAPAEEAPVAEAPGVGAPLAKPPEARPGRADAGPPAVPPAPPAERPAEPADETPTEPLGIPAVPAPAAPAALVPALVAPGPDAPTVPFPVVPPVPPVPVTSRSATPPPAGPPHAEPPVRRRSRHARPDDDTGPLPLAAPAAQPALAFLAGDPLDLFDRPGRHRRPE